MRDSLKGVDRTQDLSGKEEIKNCLTLLLNLIIAKITEIHIPERSRLLIDFFSFNLPKFILAT